MSKAVSRTEYGLAGYYWQREENRKTGQQTRGQESGCQRPQAATDATNRNCFCLSGQFSPLRLCLRSEKPYPARDTAPLGKRILLTSWRTGKQSSPPGAASRILNLSRGSLSFVETANPAILRLLPPFSIFTRALCVPGESCRKTSFALGNTIPDIKAAPFPPCTRQFCRFSKPSKSAGFSHLENLKDFQPAAGNNLKHERASALSDAPMAF